MGVYNGLNLQARMRYIKGQNTRGSHKPSWFILHPSDVRLLEKDIPELKEWQQKMGFQMLSFDNTPILEHELAKPGFPLVVMEVNT